MTEQPFPLDDTTLVMLRSACDINPDSGHTELMAFLDMGSVEKSCELLEGDESGESGAPVYLVEYEPGAAPFGPEEVIQALVDEVLRLRLSVRDSEGRDG